MFFAQESQNMYPIYSLRLLGPVQLRQNETPLNGFISQKVVALLGYLVTVNQPITRSYLATLFWPDKSETRGRGNLSRALNNLSTLLPDGLAADYFTVQIKPAIFQRVDTLIFEKLLAEQTFEALAQAVELYQGDFMEDIRLKHCPEFENWLVTERERWRNQVTGAVQRLVTHYLGRQEQTQTRYFLNRLLAVNPWQEEAHQQLMLLLARGGQRSAALMQFKICQRVLKEELGVEPAAEIIDLYQRLRAKEALPPQNLPLSALPFVGRQAEVAQIMQCLDDPHCRLLTLRGPGGVGKTRLALEAVQRLLARQYISFLNGVYFISLATLESPRQLTTALLKALQIPVREATSPQTDLLTYLKNKEVLLILDNMECVPAGKELVSQVLRQAPLVKVLLTSQLSLNLQGEWLMDVTGLGIAPAGEDTGEAGQLFEQVARHFTGRTAYTTAEKQQIRRLCQFVEGQPLALILAAEAASHTPLDTLVSQAEQKGDTWRTALADVSPRQRDLRAAFEYSWRLLTSEEQRVMGILSVFRGEFTAEQAKQVSHVTQPEILALVGKSFLGQVRPGHFHCPRILGMFAAEKLEQPSPTTR